jgi:glycerophosphoryl diester phosphodiesterase
MKKFFESKPALFTTGGAEPSLPDDTIQNFKNAIRLGSDVIRTNIFFTRDRKMVVASDALSRRKDLIKKGIGGFSLLDLRAAYGKTGGTGYRRNGGHDIPGGEGNIIFPELTQVLDSFPEQRFNFIVPVKSQEASSEFCRILAGKNAAERILVSSFSNYNLKIIRARFPDIAISFSFSGVIGFYALYKSGLLYFKKKFRADAMMIQEVMGAPRIASEGLIHEAEVRGICVYVLDVGTEEQARRLLLEGVDGFVTDNIGMIQRAKGIT